MLVYGPVQVIFRLDDIFASVNVMNYKEIAKRDGIQIWRASNKVAKVIIMF